MRNFFLLFTLIFTLIFSCKNVDKSNIENAQSPTKTEDLRNPSEVLISAHRGGSGLHNYPENCIETLDYLYNQNIKIFEIDVFQSKDNQIMMMHDDNLERTTNGNGSINDKTSDELLKYNLVDDFGVETNFKIPFLKDALLWVKDKNAYLMIDFKRSAKFENVINLINEIGVQDKCVLISYSVEQAKKLHSLAPDMQLSVSARNEQELDWILNTNIPTDKMIAFTGTVLSDKALFDRLNELKIPAILGTLGNLDKRAEARGDKLYKEWADLGVQIIATDRAIEAYKALN